MTNTIPYKVPAHCWGAPERSEIKEDLSTIENFGDDLIKRYPELEWEYFAYYTVPEKRLIASITGILPNRRRIEVLAFVPFTGAGESEWEQLDKDVIAAYD